MTSERPPATAVVIPSYARPDRLADCLGALLDDPAGDFDVIVVDDGSPEPLASLCARFGPRVRCLRQENRGPAAARNAGVAASDAEFIAFTDDDCLPRPGWVGRLRGAWAGQDDRLVGGHVENDLPENPYSSASQILCDYLYRYFGAEGGEAPFFTSNNMGCSRSRFERLGGFDERFPLAAGEDRDFGLRWRADGGRLDYVPEAAIGHRHWLDPKSFWRQHTGYGRGAHCLHRRLDARGDDRPKREPLGFYVGLLAEPLRVRGLSGLKHSALLTLSQAAMIAGYARERRASAPDDGAGSAVGR